MPAPSSIPGLIKLPQPDGSIVWCWVARQLVRDVGGFAPKTPRLWRGSGEPSDTELTDIVRSAETLALDLRDWRAGKIREARQPSQRIRGLIYFIRAHDRVKIGFTRALDARLRQIQKQVPYKIELLATLAGSPALERDLHARFSTIAIHNEWFEFAAPIIEFLAAENKRKKQLSESFADCQNRREKA